MVDIIANYDLFINIGTDQEKKSFTKGLKYKYFYLDSGWENHKVESNQGMPSFFNEEEFNKYFNL